MEEGDFLRFCKESGYQDANLFKKAIAFAEDKFEDKKRLSGETVLSHNLNVASILVENSSEPEIITAGILHGLSSFKTEITSKFGEAIFSLVKQVDDIKEIKDKNKGLRVDTIKKILITTIKDTRILLVKIANRIDNLKTVHVFDKERQKLIAEETLEFYAPIAYRLGAVKLRVQLEDLAFKLLNPKKYEEINNFLKQTSEQREKDISKVIEQIKDVSKRQINIEKIKGRPKHVYSIYKKMVFKKKKLEEQHDLLGIRIIVPEEKDCYTMLAILHENYEPIDGRLKDYILHPKPNLYRSIHTCIKMLDNKIVEIQIRTPEMDELAEEGIAAHWKYKGLKSEEAFEKKISWIRQVLELSKDTDTKEFLESAQVDVFGDSIHCYTPKGDVKELPKGATVLDFAFTVHEQVGKTAIGGMINGKFAALKKELHKGDVVEIITNKNQRPHRDWLKYVRGTNARHKIRRFLKEYETLPTPRYRLPKIVTNDEKAFLVESKDFPNAVCSLAKCCHPLPGEDITGITTKKRVISVHKIDCKQALKEENRWVKVTWKDSFNQKINFIIKARERSGLLADLLHTIANASFEVREAKAKLTGPDDMECSFLVIPRSLEHLKELITRICKVKGVLRIYFEG